AIAVAQEAIVGRSHRGDFAETGKLAEGAAAVADALARTGSEGRCEASRSADAGIGEVGMVEDVVPLEVQPHVDALGELEALGDIEVGPLEAGSAPEGAVAAGKLAICRQQRLAPGCRVEALVAGAVPNRGEGSGIEPLVGAGLRAVEHRDRRAGRIALGHRGADELIDPFALGIGVYPANQRAVYGAASLNQVAVERTAASGADENRLSALGEGGTSDHPAIDDVAEQAIAGVEGQCIGIGRVHHVRDVVRASGIGVAEAGRHAGGVGVRRAGGQAVAQRVVQVERDAVAEPLDQASLHRVIASVAVVPRLAVPQETRIGRAGAAGRAERVHSEAAIADGLVAVLPDRVAVMLRARAHVADAERGVPPHLLRHGTVQQQRGRNTSFSVGYVGTRSQHNSYTVGENGYQSVCDGCFAVYPFSSTGGAGSPDPRFLGYSQTRYDGYGRYDSMQAGLVQRLSHGITLNLNYTLSHCLTTGTPYSDAAGVATSLSNTYATCSNDITHVVNAAYTYTLPFHSSNSLLGNIVNGWMITGSTFSQGGQPVFIGSGGSSSFNGNLVQTSGPVHGALVRGVDPYAKGKWINQFVSTAVTKSNPTGAPVTVFDGTQTGAYQWFNPAAFAPIWDSTSHQCFNPATGSESLLAADCQFSGSN